MHQDELDRLRKMRSFAYEANKRGKTHIAGIDEAGRGPLAGPVVAATVIFLEEIFIEGVNDSKKLTKKKRETIYKSITSHEKNAVGVGIVSEKEIDSVNILEATRKAMCSAIDSLSVTPHLILVDGMIIPNILIPQQKIINGDALCYSIAAASIIAKVVRDTIMEDFDSQYPEYGFAKHKGYGTREHMISLRRHGPCKIHRKSFAPVAKLL